MLNRQASKVSPSAEKVRSATIRIEHREPVVSYWRKSEHDGETGYEYSYQLRTDDPELSAETGGARKFWDGDALVSEFCTGRPDSLTVSWSHELLDGWRRLRAIAKIRGEGQNFDNVWEFERRQPESSQEATRSSRKHRPDDAPAEMSADSAFWC